MSKVYIFLADGFEEIEALTVVDIMRRADMDLTTVSIMENRREVIGSHKIPVIADEVWGESVYDKADMLVLPGGEPGTTNLENYQPLTKLVTEFADRGGEIAAICAAPRIFAGLGLLDGKEATCYPSVMEKLTKAVKKEDAVVVSGNITTSRGMGTAIEFALALVKRLEGVEKAEKIAKSIVYYR